MTLKFKIRKFILSPLKFIRRTIFNGLFLILKINIILSILYNNVIKKCSEILRNLKFKNTRQFCQKKEFL